MRVFPARVVENMDIAPEPIDAVCGVLVPPIFAVEGVNLEGKLVPGSVDPACSVTVTVVRVIE